MGLSYAAHALRACCPLEGKPITGIGTGKDGGDVGNWLFCSIGSGRGHSTRHLADVIGNNTMLSPAIHGSDNDPVLF